MNQKTIVFISIYLTEEVAIQRRWPVLDDSSTDIQYLFLSSPEREAGHLGLSWCAEGPHPKNTSLYLHRNPSTAGPVLAHDLHLKQIVGVSKFVDINVWCTQTKN